MSSEFFKKSQIQMTVLQEFRSELVGNEAVADCRILMEIILHYLSISIRILEILWKVWRILIRILVKILKDLFSSEYLWKIWRISIWILQELNFQSEFWKFEEFRSEYWWKFWRISIKSLKIFDQNTVKRFEGFWSEFWWLHDYGILQKLNFDQNTGEKSEVSDQNSDDYRILQELQ